MIRIRCGKSRAQSTGPGRGGPKIDPDVENLIVQMARENSGWGYDRIAGALTNLGHQISDPRSAMYCAGMGVPRLRNGVRRLHGTISSPRIWRFGRHGFHHR
jgi:hypothetical protein